MKSLKPKNAKSKSRLQEYLDQQQNQDGGNSITGNQNGYDEEEFDSGDGSGGPLKANKIKNNQKRKMQSNICLLYTSPSPRDVEESRMPSSA